MRPERGVTVFAMAAGRGCREEAEVEAVGGFSW